MALVFHVAHPNRSLDVEGSVGVLFLQVIFFERVIQQKLPMDLLLFFILVLRNDSLKLAAQRVALGNIESASSNIEDIASEVEVEGWQFLFVAPLVDQLEVLFLLFGNTSIDL